MSCDQKDTSTFLLGIRSIANDASSKETSYLHFSGPQHMTVVTFEYYLYVYGGKTRRNF